MLIENYSMIFVFPDTDIFRVLERRAFVERNEASDDVHAPVEHNYDALSRRDVLNVFAYTKAANNSVFVE